MFTNKKLARTFFVMISMIALFLICSPIAQAQNWAAMPPYNTLWPLWSPALSPIDPGTGLPVPIVDQLTLDTILPVQPGLTWDPAADNPWLLYNTPLGMAYYDPITGVDLWPPSYLLDPSGGPLPLTLPPDYGLLPPTASSWINTTVPQGNLAILNYLMTIPAPIFAPGLGGLTSLFLSPSALLPVAPLPVPTAVVPTVVAPTIVAPTVVAPTLLAPTVAAPLPVPTTAVVPTIVAPTVVAPLPVPTVVAPTIVAPTVVAPTVVAPTIVAPTVAVISGYFLPFI